MKKARVIKSLFAISNGVRLISGVLAEKTTTAEAMVYAIIWQQWYLQ